jgi:hypothetical protein
MWSFIGSKANQQWIWLAIDEQGMGGAQEVPCAPSHTLA